MVKPTLSTMLTITQKTQPLPNEGGSPGGHLYFEHDVVNNLFQVPHELRLTPGTCVSQRSHQPLQGCRLAIGFRRQALCQQNPSRVMTTQATVTTIPCLRALRLHTLGQL